MSKKYEGRIRPEDVSGIVLADVSIRSPDAVASKLRQPTNEQVRVVNVVAYHDLEVLVTGLLRAKATGKHLNYRTAVSFARVRSGLAPHPILTYADLHFQVVEALQIDHNRVS